MYSKIIHFISFLREKNEIWDYIIFGVLATLLNIVLFFMAINACITTISANTIAAFISIIFAYTTNKIWVFKTRDFRAKIIIKEMITFFTGRLFTFILETIILKLCIDILFFNRVYTKIATNIIVIVLNYIISKKAVFRKQA